MDNDKKNSLAAARASAQIAFLTKVINGKGVSPHTKKKAQAKLDYIFKHGSLDD